MDREREIRATIQKLCQLMEIETVKPKDIKSTFMRHYKQACEMGGVPITTFSAADYTLDFVVMHMWNAAVKEFLNELRTWILDPKNIAC